jgi:hypothetical protein
LAPNYNKWAERQAARAQATGDNSPASAVAKAVVKLNKQFQEDDRQGKERTLDRLNRRIMENNAFSQVSKNKNYQLTNDEYNEIETFRMMNDPEHLKNKMEETEEILKEMDGVDGADVEKPSDYFGKDQSMPVGFGGSMNLGNKLLQLAKSAWAKSFASDFMEETNASQLKVGVG